MTNLDGYPLFRCNRALFAYWSAGGVLRRELCNTISKTWKTGVVILTPALYAVGTVDPRGNPGQLSPPYQRFEMWQICNAPSAKYKECACRMFFDPESQGPWGARDDARARDRHHPHCQFTMRALVGWKKDYQNAMARLLDDKSPQARPDEWLRTEDAVRSGTSP
jgi:hypothetical protein